MSKKKKKEMVGVVERRGEHSKTSPRPPTGRLQGVGEEEGQRGERGEIRDGGGRGRKGEKRRSRGQER